MESVICEKDFYHIHNNGYKQLIFNKGCSYRWEYGSGTFYIGFILVYLELSQSFFSFTGDKFNEYFIPLKEQRKLKLKKLQKL